MYGHRYGRKKFQKTFKRSLPEVQQENNPFVHLRKTPAELILDQGVGRPKTIVQALVILNELTPTGVQLFSETPFYPGEEITLNIPSLRNFFVKARIVSCKERPSNPGILPTKSFRHRVGLEFDFQSESEAQAVRDYCNYLKATFLSLAA
jgi:hypothetical protein